MSQQTPHEHGQVGAMGFSNLTLTSNIFMLAFLASLFCRELHNFTFSTTRLCFILLIHAYQVPPFWPLRLYPTTIYHWQAQNS